MADTAPLAISFLYEVFVTGNGREVAQAELEGKLEDLLYALRESLGTEVFPRTALAYLNEWADDDHK